MGHTHIPLFLSLSGDDVVTLYKDTKATSRHLFFSISFFFLFFSICLDFFAERLNQEVEQKFVAFYERVFWEAKEVEHLHLGHRMKDRSRYHHLIVYFCSELKNFAFSTILCIITP